MTDSSRRELLIWCISDMNLELFKQKYNISFCITNRNLGIEQNALLLDFLALG